MWFKACMVIMSHEFLSPNFVVLRFLLWVWFFFCFQMILDGNSLIHWRRRQNFLFYNFLLTCSWYLFFAIQDWKMLWNLQKLASLSCFIAYSLYHELAFLCTFVDMAARILGHVTAWRHCIIFDIEFFM